MCSFGKWMHYGYVGRKTIWWSITFYRSDSLVSPNQHRHSTEGKIQINKSAHKINVHNLCK